MNLSIRTDDNDIASGGGGGGVSQSAGLADAPPVPAAGLTPYDVRTYFEQFWRDDGKPWWTSDTWRNLVSRYGLDPVVRVMTEIVRRLELGEDPGVIAGGPLPVHAAGRAVEWLVRNFTPAEAGSWLRMGAWNPPVVRAFISAGGTAEMLGAEDGTLATTQHGPRVFAEAGPFELSGEPLVDYLMFGELSPGEAIRLALGRYSVVFDEGFGACPISE